MTIRKLLDEALLRAPEGKGGGDGEPQIDSDDLTADEQALFERMQQETPMPSRNEGGDPPAEGQAEPADGKPRPKLAADDDPDLEDGEEEIVTEGQQRDEQGRYVPKSAYLRVKELRKADRDALQQTREKQIQTEARLNQLMEIIGTPEGQKPGEQGKSDNPWDEPDVDPVADIFAAFEQQKRRSTWEREQRETSATTQSQRDTEVSIANSYRQDAMRFAGEQIKRGEIVKGGDGQEMPAFQAAYGYAINLRHAQLQAFGIADEAQRNTIIAKEERDLIHDAIQNKKSPAEAVWNFAVASGFKPPAKANGQAKVNGKSPVEQHLEKVRDGMARNKSLSGAGGAGYSGVTGAEIANMGDDEFSEFFDKLTPAQQRKLLGAEA